MATKGRIEARIRWVSENQDLWEDMKALIKKSKEDGIYSEKTVVHDIKKRLVKTIKDLQNQN